jgi:predicted nucleotidyltransferase
MITLWKTGFSKILNLFYEDKNLSIHLREIARKTKLHEPSVTKFLNQLEKEKILKSKKEANLKKYYINKSKTTFLAFQTFDVEKLEKLPSIRKDAIKIYLNSLKEKPVFAILFGSTAKENYKDDSDIDILIITNNIISTKEAEKEVDALTAIKVSSFQMKYSDFLTELKMKEDKIVQSAIFSGYPLINHLEYYQIILNP